jgi:NADH-quinone oxidoreductase subunit G/NADP-reducing hydrogenase subunit HndD
VVTIEVNRRAVRARPGEMLLGALRRAGIRVPTLCHVPGLSAGGACRLCVVEVEGAECLSPSCATPVEEGMKVLTHSPRAVRARQTLVELLLANHPDDCLYCVRNGTCQLQALAEELGVRQRRYVGARDEYRIDASSPAIVRDRDKCILCGKCVRVCEEVQGVSAIDFQGRGSGASVGAAFGEDLDAASCVYCGQCLMACPTGAVREQSHVQEVLGALEEGGRFAAVQHGPSVSVALAEEFGMDAGRDVAGAMTAALRGLGFDAVFETAFGADLVAMEEASELIERLKGGGRLPLLTSCSPAWVKFVEEFYPDFIDNLSTCKSPQQMLGAVIKGPYAQGAGLDPSRILSVAVMPCTAKKFEARRPEMSRGGRADVDAVLTTRELARIIRMRGLDLAVLDPQPADAPLGERSSAGKLFGAAGGATESVIRAAHWLAAGTDLPQRRMQTIRAAEGIKETRVRIGALEVGAAVVSGLAGARRLLDEIRAGWRDVQFVEVMACPGGCVAGGGQPLGAADRAVRARRQALYRIDREEPIRAAYANPAVQALYRDFLGKPLGERSRELLHTRYARREVVT